MTRSKSARRRSASLSPSLGCLDRTIQALLQRGEIGKRELGVDDLHIAERIDAAGDMDHVGALEAPHHVCNRIHLADVCQKLVAETLALRSTGHEARDVDELHRGRQDLLRVCDRSQLVEPRVRDRHHPDVRIDRAEGVVFGRDLRARECVEQRRFTDVGQTNDAAADRHGAFSFLG